MSARPTRQPRARLRSGAIALALLAPAAEPAVAGASDLPEEAGSEGTGELTPQQPDTGDVEDENTPPLGAPGDTSDPNEGENEDGPLEPEPPVEPPQEGEPPPESPPVPPAAAPAPPPVVPQSTAPAPPPVAESVPAPASKAPPVRRRATPAPERKATTRRVVRQATSRPASPPPVRAVSPAQTGPSQRAVVTPVAEPAASGPTHTVRAGDSLWAIASTRLGPGASAGQIAREVQRLWDLNARAIGTGDPSLLRVGVQLRLR